MKFNCVHYALQLTFQHFDLEHHTDCGFDYLEIREGETEEGPLVGVLHAVDPGCSEVQVGRYCGRGSASLPPPHTSSSNSLYIQFRSDYSVGGAGFRATYQVRVSGISCI